MAFYVNMSGGTEVPDALITLWEKAYLMAYFQKDVTSGFAEEHRIAGKAGIVVKYNNIAVDTTPLGEYDQPSAKALSETQILFTPAEHGDVVSRTSLASIQTGGQIDLAAFSAVGNAAAIKANKLATEALEATTNVAGVGGHSAATMATTDVMTIANVNAMYNKLARANVPTVDGNLYIALAHDDVLQDIRSTFGAGSWTDTNKYTNITPLTNEIGSFGGFRWIRNNDANITLKGAHTADTYKTTFLGAEGLLRGVSKDLAPIMTGPFDNLGRFVNIGYYGVLQYKIARPESVWQLLSASSVAAN